MFEKALLVNITNSLEQLSFIINGDIQTIPTPFINIELCLTINENTKYIVRYFFFNIQYRRFNIFQLTFRPSLEELTETLNAISKNQLIELIKHFVRLCDLFSYHPFEREVLRLLLIIFYKIFLIFQPYYTVINNHSIKEKLENKITLGISNCILEIDKYIENNWFHFRQLWEIDKESFITVYKSENSDLQGLEADIAR